MRTWMNDPSYSRKDVTGFVKEIVARGKKRGELDPAIDHHQATDLYYMFCYRWIHMWFYRGRKEKLTDSLPGIFHFFGNPFLLGKT